ncbi:4Fe-4S dicluster domain-containing protein [Candidatus Bathyarchaeota archaeon]|nr:4Fe-4S dicluster domain-containing protein [Candidatus Bathyarchaeota archaeon]
MKRIKVDITKCTGCRTCELVCSFYHTKKFSPSTSRIRVIKEDVIGMDYPVMCHQCDDCTALNNCPVGAMSKTIDGVIDIDYIKCIGCGNCLVYCKYSAVKIYENKPILCNLCNGNPSCVLKCPTNALLFEENVAEPNAPWIEHEKFMKEWKKPE